MMKEDKIKINQGKIIPKLKIILDHFKLWYTYYIVRK